MPTFPNRTPLMRFSLVILVVFATAFGCGRAPAVNSSEPTGGTEPISAGSRLPADPPIKAQKNEPPVPQGEKKNPPFLDATAKHQGKTLSEWITALGDEDDLNRSDAADAVAKYGPNAKDAVPGLIVLLKHPSDLSFISALTALTAIGPAAGGAVDPLIELLKQKDMNIRKLVAGTLADLGPAAGRAVPALIKALDGVKADTDRDAFRAPIREIGKYDLRVVFAAFRKEILNDVDLESVVNSLGTGDAFAVAALIEELKDRDHIFYALSGLKRIGRKAAPAVSAVRALLSDKNPDVRKDAAEVIEAIGPQKEGVDPPVVAPAGKSAEAPDPAVAAVLGPESKTYKEAGYKDVLLGATFDEVNKNKPLKWTRVGQPWVFMPNLAGEEEFVFDADKKLVCYTRSYVGGPDDYRDKLVEVFGTSDREPREIIGSTPDSVSRRTATDYTFGKVLARVVFVKTARDGPAGRPVIVEQTHVAVIDRAWASGVLDTNAKGKRKAVEWVRAVGEKIKGGEVDLKSLPKIDGGEGRAFPKEREVAKFFDLRREELNNQKEKRPQLPAVFAAVEKFVRPGDPARKPVVRANFVFERFTPLATPPVFGQDEPQKGAVRRKTANNPLDYTPFGNLLSELNVELMREAFPPKGDKIEYVRPATGVPYYEWRTKEGWLVNCRTDDGVTIEWLGDKGL